MRRWWWVLLLLLSLGVNLGLAGMVMFKKAQPKNAERHPAEEAPPPEPSPGGGDLVVRLTRFADFLKLEGEPRRKFLDIQMALFQDSTRQRLRLQEVHRDLRRELSGEHPDPARAEALLRESADVYLQMEKLLVKSILDSRRLLGPDREKPYLAVISRVRLPAAAAPGFPGGLGPGALNRPGGRANRPGLRRLQQMRQEMKREQMQPPPGPGAMAPDPADDADLPPAVRQRIQQGDVPPWMQERLRQRRLRRQQMQRGRGFQPGPQPGKPPPGEAPQGPPPPVYLP
jgi:hypothetical protein